MTLWQCDRKAACTKPAWNWKQLNGNESSINFIFHKWTFPYMTHDKHDIDSVWQDTTENKLFEFRKSTLEK